jgi:hypothetical protein
MQVLKLTTAFSDLKICAPSAISICPFSTGIDEAKQLSMMSIQFIFSIFILPLPNVQLLQGEILVATKYRRRRAPSSTFRACPASSSRSVMEIEIRLSGNYLQHRIVCVQNELISLFHIQGLRILADARQIFVDRSPRLQQPISYFLDSDVYIHLMCLMFHTSSLLLVFILFRIIVIQLNHGHS